MQKSHHEKTKNASAFDEKPDLSSDVTRKFLTLQPL